MVSSLSERFRRAVVTDNLTAAKTIAERALEETFNDAQPFDVRNQTILRPKQQHMYHYNSSEGGGVGSGNGSGSCSILASASAELLPALSASQHHFARQSRGRERSRQTGRCKSSLTLAIENGASIEMVQWLLDMEHERGAYSQDIRNCTMVSLAAQYNRIDVIEALCIDAVANAASTHHRRATAFGTPLRHALHKQDEEDEEDERETEGLYSEDSNDLAQISTKAISLPNELWEREELMSQPSPSGVSSSTAAAAKSKSSTDKDLPDVPSFATNADGSDGLSDFLDRIDDDDSKDNDYDVVITDDEDDLVNKELVQLLDSPDELGRTAIALACMKGYRDVVNQLLDMGANINQPDYEGNTPLHYAASYNHLLVVQLLIERGCTFAGKNAHGFMAADYAYTASLKGALEAFARAKYERDRKAVHDNGGDRSTQPFKKLKNSLFSPSKSMQATQHRLVNQLRDL